MIWVRSLGSRILRDDRGAVAVVTALVLVAVLILTALVLDLAALRTDMRASHTVADITSIAGVIELTASAYAACLAAWHYFLANTGMSAPDPCGPFLSASFVCAPDTPSTTVIGTAGPYVVRMTTPVPDSSPLMMGWISPDIDGAPCERFAVEIFRGRDFLFAPVIDSSSGQTGVSAVARTSIGNVSGELVALVVLDSTGCLALLADGQGKILVMANGETPGYIIVDSSGTEMNDSDSSRNCSGSDAYVTDVQGSNAKIEAQDATSASGFPIPAAIFQYALMPGQGNSIAYDPRDVPDRLYPRPIPKEPITRAPIDQRYNNDPPYINLLRQRIGCPTSASPCASFVPAGFSEFPAEFPGGDCVREPSDPPIALSGNWYINCSPFKVSSGVSIQSGNVVFEGSVHVTSETGSLQIGSPSGPEVYVAFRSGDLLKDAQAKLEMWKTALYIHNGRVDLRGGDKGGTLTWIAPFEGDFEDLALWSESGYQPTNPHVIEGQAGLNLEGVYFMPNALFRFAGQGLQVQTKAQFIAWRVRATGQGTLKMQPDPDRIVLIPILGVRLIR